MQSQTHSPTAHATPPAVSADAPPPSTFAALGLRNVLLSALREAGYAHPTPIQREAIPPALDGRDVLGCARTGTGKTAAFVLPLLQHMLAAPQPRGKASRPRALVLAPTRELASQITESVTTYGSGTGVRPLAIFGGVSQHKQVQALRRGVDLLVATPGRLVDLLDQRVVDLTAIDILVLDEFDRMLDQGFLPAIRRVLRDVPTQRQTLLFSASMPPELGAVVKQIVRDPVRVAVSPTSSTPEDIDQTVWFVDNQSKRATLTRLLEDPDITCALAFTRTKHGANRLAKQLVASGIHSDAIHGNKSQGARERTLRDFKGGKLRVLVATDIAARGIDVDGVSHVINFDLPSDPESYVHRIGRTARAGRSGAAISLCPSEDRSKLTRIEKLIGQRLRPMNTAAPGAAPTRPSQPPPRNVRRRKPRARDTFAR